MIALQNSKKNVAFAREGIIRESGKPIDVVSVDCWEVRMEGSVTILRRYVAFAKAHRFRLIGSAELVVGGIILAEDSAVTAMRGVSEGMRGDTKVKSVLASGL